MSRITWKTNAAPSIFHALRLLGAGRPVVEHRLIELLAPLASPVRELKLSDAFWLDLISDWLRQPDSAIASLATPGAEPREEVAKIVMAAEKRVADAGFDVPEELRIRQRPLRELWEAHGPGLLILMAETTGQPVAVDAEVFGLIPLQGGDGTSFSALRKIQIESVLANSAPEVPETLRLAWLLAQLSLPDDDCRFASQCALVPCCLMAADELGVGTFSARTVATALRAWRLTDGADLATTLNEWWVRRDPAVTWRSAVMQLRDRLVS